MIHRRKLLAALGTGALANLLPAALPAFAQPAKPPEKIWRVGILAPRTRPASLDTDNYGGILRGLREFGYIEGKNLMIEWRFADNDIARLPALAAELVQWNPDVLISGGESAALAMQRATSTAPVVIAGVSDPVGSGLVSSLARPGGNITGVSSISGELGPKRLQMLLEMTSGMTPKVSRVAVLANPTAPGNLKTLENVQAAAAALKVKIVPAEARTAQEIDAAFALMVQQRAGAVFVILNPLFQQQRSQIAQLAAKHRLPSMTAARAYVEAGCLMSYGANLTEEFRRTGFYVDKIFKGAQPSDLPVEQPTRFELFINGKTAKALGLKIPQSLLITAERVIE